MNRAGLARVDLYTHWAGTVEGQVKDVAGPPADAFVFLQHADDATARELQETRTNSDGFFHFRGLPIGRYTLGLNPYGPYEGSPFPSLYYPSALEREHAEA